MDTPSSESSLDVNQAAAAFADILEPKKQEAAEETPEVEAKPAVQDESEPESVEAEETEDSGTITVKIDGKDVELTPEQIAEAYKSGLRQDDYTRKTMAVAEQRKAAEAEYAKAQAERNELAQKLNESGVILQNALNEQKQIDWDNLLNNDPIEYMRQQHLFQQRQAQLAQVQKDYADLYQRQQADDKKALENFVQAQQQELLAKLPEWKDEAKAKAERASIREFLSKNGYSDKELDAVNDHRSVILARKAMLYDQMVAKASAAAKKVEGLPPKVEKPGVTEARLDKRGQAFQRLQKTGRVEDAAAVFANFV